MPTGTEEGTTFILDKPYQGKWKMLLQNEQDDNKKRFQYRYILINHKNN